MGMLDPGAIWKTTYHNMGRLFLKNFLAGLLGISLMVGLCWDLRDLRLTVCQKRMSLPFFAAEYEISFKLGEVQGLLGQGNSARARFRLEEVEKEAASYRGSYPEYLWFELGLLWAASDETDRAIPYLEAALSKGKKKQVQDFLNHPALETLKKSPEFQALQRL